MIHNRDSNSRTNRNSSSSSSSSKNDNNDNVVLPEACGILDAVFQGPVRPRSFSGSAALTSIACII